VTATSDTITRLISYAWTDWSVTLSEETSVIGALRADPDMSATVNALKATGMLSKMMARVTTPPHPQVLAEVLGAGCDASARAKIDLTFLNQDQVWAFWVSAYLHEHLRAIGATFTAAAFNPVPYNKLIPKQRTFPFGGVGATGIAATRLSVPLAHQAAMVLGHNATLAQYRNPIPGSLPAYLATLTPAERRQQAELLLSRPLVSVVSNSYIGGLPSRAQIIKLAAAQYRLAPATLAAFILAEQRDQSQNEDAVELASARSELKPGNTSIGLGQIVVSTAKKEDLFEPLLDLTFRTALSRSEIALLLTSEEFNIFGVAKYLRRVADRATGFTRLALPDTAATFPGINFAAFGLSSDRWPDDNIRALGSEYTSRAWDDVLVPAWGDFVFEAYKDIQASGIF
jgi:hypothetical protein